jgi:hypothetical protein
MEIVDLIEITLPDEDAFLKIRETLTRIGLASKRDNTLYQSCHILHKRGKYYIVHFKEMFVLDGKQSTLDQEDIARRNTIIDLLTQWNLCLVVEPEKIKEPRASMNHVKVIPFKQKSDWNLVAKYTIGKKD